MEVLACRLLLPNVTKDSPRQQSLELLRQLFRQMNADWYKADALLDTWLIPIGHCIRRSAKALVDRIHPTSLLARQLRTQHTLYATLVRLTVQKVYRLAIVMRVIGQARLEQSATCAADK
jgi:hypothetical protein